MSLGSSVQRYRAYGRGPFENYVDRHTGSRLGVWEGRNEQRYNDQLLKPQDSGNRCDVRFAEIRGSAAAFRVSAGSRPIYLSLSHKLYSDYAHAGHIEDVPDRALTTLCVDGFVRGSGSGSCGPLTEAPYKIRLKPFSPLRYSFVVERID